jgi:hypothetical protein
MADIEHPGIGRTAAGGFTPALVSYAVLDAAFAWLCKRRRAWPADADIWSIRHDWPDEKPRIKAAPVGFRLLQRLTKVDASEADLWSAAMRSC